tara:strand:- start:95 stop:394 length:300 start_codon:yes stop_codon:yes gene_type:complete
MKSKIIFKSLILVSFLFSSIAFAIGLDEAKQQGLVVVQKNAQILVNDINAKRKAVYVKLAAKNGITLQQVEKLAAEKTYKKTSTGNYLWMSGKWAKKEG